MLPVDFAYFSQTQANTQFGCQFDIALMSLQIGIVLDLKRMNRLLSE
jgi:hypothetical protein